MLVRVLEPEVMDTAEEASAYDTMDHSEVNRRFVADLLARHPAPGRVLDLGTGTALIPLELARAEASCRIVAVDLAAHMLARARENVAGAGLADRIELRLVDAKSAPFRRGEFDLVMSNSIVHHIPDPRTLFRQIAELLEPATGLFVRDLFRPDTEAELAALVTRYAGDADPTQRELFRASLAAALTVDEARGMAEEVGLRGARVEMTSDRHWTMTRDAR
jgi:ubiquinone/menaquinone biosynthesis C-methylase UbiE